MKKIGITMLLAAAMMQGFSQESAAKKIIPVPEPVPEDTSEIMKVVVGQDRLIIEDGKETLKVKIGNRGFTILESLESGESKIQFEKYKEESFEDEKFSSSYNDDQDDDRADRRSRFRGHWAGIEFGFNNFSTSDYSLILPDNISYMSLHSGKSHNFNINFSQVSLGLARRIGIVTGLGINWNNYRFDRNNNIMKAESGMIEELDPGVLLKKSKFSTLYLQLPLLLEFQIPADHSHINIAAGPIGAVKLSSNTKMVYEDGDKVKSDADLSLNMLRYGGTARVGFENLQITGTYYLTPLFKTGKGPGGIDLFPFEIGLAFTID